MELNRVVSSRRTLTTTLGRAPTIKEIADAAGLQAAEVHELLRVDQLTKSLDAPASKDGRSTLAELLPDRSSVPPEEAAEAVMRTQAVKASLADLSADLRAVVQLRFGFDGEEPQTLGQTGARIGLSRERVRQIEGEALRLLADICRERGVEPA